MVKVGSYVYFALNQTQYVELFPNMRAQKDQMHPWLWRKK